VLRDNDLVEETAMQKKGGIQQQANEARQEIIKSDERFYRELMNEHFPNYLEKKETGKVEKSRCIKPLWVSLSSIGTVVTVFLFSMIFWLPYLLSDDSGSRKNYLAENEELVDSALNELNADLNGILVTFTDGYEIDIFKRKYDSVSNDTLLYFIVVSNENTFETLAIYFYTNPDYKLKEKLNEVESIFIDEFKVDYNKDVEKIEDFGIFVLNYRAVFEYNKTIFYIEYEQVSLDETGNLFAFIEQTFQII
jgi:hypothetical protein